MIGYTNPRSASDLSISCPALNFVLSIFQKERARIRTPIHIMKNGEENVLFLLQAVHQIW